MTKSEVIIGVAVFALGLLRYLASPRRTAARPAAGSGRGVGDIILGDPSSNILSNPIRYKKFFQEIVDLHKHVDKHLERLVSFSAISTQPAHIFHL
jgi:hypothetical protein